MKKILLVGTLAVSLIGCTQGIPPDDIQPQQAVPSPIITQGCDEIAKPGCEAIESLREAAYKLQIHLDSSGNTVDLQHEINTLFCAADNLQVVCDTL